MRFIHQSIALQCGYPLKLNTFTIYTVIQIFLTLLRISFTVNLRHNKLVLFLNRPSSGFGLVLVLHFLLMSNKLPTYLIILKFLWVRSLDKMLCVGSRCEPGRDLLEGLASSSKLTGCWQNSQGPAFLVLSLSRGHSRLQSVSSGACAIALCNGQVTIQLFASLKPVGESPASGRTFFLF